MFGNSFVRVGTQGLFCPYLKTFVPPFLPTRLTAPVSEDGFVRDICSYKFKIVSNFTRLTARGIMYNNFEILLVVFMPNINTNDTITYTNPCFCATGCNSESTRLEMRSIGYTGTV